MAEHAVEAPQKQQGAPVVTRLEVERREVGASQEIGVSYVLTAHYADREPVRIARAGIKALHANTRAARMPEAVAGRLARHGGMAYRVAGGWSLVDPASEAAHLAGGVTREEVEEARRRALASFSAAFREGLRNAPASEVLAEEFTFTQREAARLERLSAKEGSAMKRRHERAATMLEAALRFEAQ